MKSEIVREYPAVDTHNYITPKKDTKDQFVNGTNGNADSSKNTDELTNKNVDVSNKNRSQLWITNISDYIWPNYDDLTVLPHWNHG